MIFNIFSSLNSIYIQQRDISHYHNISKLTVNPDVTLPDNQECDMFCCWLWLYIERMTIMLQDVCQILLRNKKLIGNKILQCLITAILVANKLRVWKV